MDAVVFVKDDCIVHGHTRYGVVEGKTNLKPAFYSPQFNLLDAKNVFCSIYYLTNRDGGKGFVTCEQVVNAECRVFTAEEQQLGAEKTSSQF